MKPSRLESLLDAYINRALTDEDRAELERLLLSSPEARRQFWDQARFHGLLSHWGQQEWGRRLAEAPATTRKQWRNQAADLANAIRHRMPWSWGWAVGLAGMACLAAAVTVWLQVPATPTPAPIEVVNVAEFHSEGPAGIAVMTRAAFVEWMDATNAPANGAVLAPGWLRFRSGAIQVEFSSGARVILEGPAELELRSANEAFLRSGRLSAFVPPAARGFAVRSPQLSLVDHGTEFGMAVPASGPAEAHVFTGKVEVSEPGRTAARSLTEGQGLRVQGGAFQPIPAQRGAFLREEQLASQESDWERRRFGSWKKSSVALSADPATLVHYTFEGQPGWQRTLNNQAAEALPATMGSIVGCDWTEGRWPGKGALEFKGRAERVKLSVPGQYQALSYFAWVRVDALPHAYQSLMMTEGEHAGAVHWSLVHTGGLRIAVVPLKTQAPAQWDVINSPAVTPDWLGHWILLTSVVETNRLLSYINGQLAGMGNRQTSVPLRLDRVELGNWGATRETPGMEWADRPAWFWNRGFKGRIDEFGLLARALSAEEVRRLYEQGRPGGETGALAAAR